MASMGLVHAKEKLEEANRYNISAGNSVHDNISIFSHRMLVARPPSKPRAAPTPSMRVSVEPRRSGRVQNLPVPTYNADRIFRCLEGEEVRYDSS